MNTFSFPGQPAPSSTPPGSRGSELKRELAELGKMVALFLIVFLGLKTFVVEGYEVQGESMAPTLQDRERILVMKLPHRLSQIPLLSGLRAFGAGDIIVFESREEMNKRYIKRVVAEGPPLRGAPKVSASDGGWDSERVSVDYVDGELFVNRLLITEEYVLPDQRMSRENDHRTLSPGSYYVLGDHRSVSKDSRAFGAVHRDQIIGKAVLRFWPPSKFGSL